MFYNIIFAPIERIVEWAFLFIHNKFPSLNIIYAIVFVSLVINFLALPLYNIADNIQAKERQISKSLEYRVNRIKKAFKGDMQFMMINEYYRQNDYHPLYVLRGSLSILIEIPFFIAAYYYLSNCDLLKDASWWIFPNLGEPDSLVNFTFVGKQVTINILPVVMTLINFISGAVYLKDAPAREKIQLYGIGAVFSVLLYNKPSGLVIYWILNNLFSLAKNIVLRFSNPKKVLHIILTVFIILLSLMYWVFKPETFLWKKCFLAGCAILFALIPVIYGLLKQSVIYVSIKETINSSDDKKSFVIFITSCISLWILCGLLLPSSVIASSPIEFSFIGATDSPITYILSSFSFFFGLFVFWPSVIYKMFGDKVKSTMTVVFFVAAICALCNAYIFKSDYGTINNRFVLDSSTALANISMITHLLVPAAVAITVLIFLLATKYSKTQYLQLVMISIILAQMSFSIYKISGIKKTFDEYSLSQNREIEDKETTITPVYHLSRTGKNVIVLFLDRAIGAFSEHIFNQFPELKTDFSGFIYYPNTLSGGGNTINGFPPITGGYEYSSEEIYKRKDELLVDKHNEALQVMPLLFYNAGFDVTYTDPSICNYAWYGDLSIFDKYPNMNVSTEFGKYTLRYADEKGIKQVSEPSDITTKSQIKNFSILQILFPSLRTVFYDIAFDLTDDIIPFVKHMSNLYYLPKLTDFISQNNTLTIIENEVTQRPIFLQAPDYEKPIETRDQIVRNNDYSNFDDIDLMDYNANIAAYKQISKFLQYLKDNNVYDNTRIIIVSDHGYHHHYTTFDNFEDPVQPSSFNCLLMVKDFNKIGEVKADYAFMTNADTLFFAKEGLDVSDVNPFTGKKN